MNRAFFEIDPELSDFAFATLANNGVEPEFERRGVGADLVSVPADKAEVARRIIDGLQL